MTDKTKLKERGNSIAGVGGLFTILSLTIIKDQNWQIVAAAIGLALALYGVLLIGKAKKEEPEK